MKDIKDYLFFYIGRKAMVRFGQMKPSVRRISLINLYTWFGSELQKTDYQKYYDIKPIIRPVSDITREEMLERGNYLLDVQSGLHVDAEYFRWMLSNGFDVFGLIEAGLAIDATTLKQES